MTRLKWAGWAISAAIGLVVGAAREERQWRAARAMHESPHRYL